MTLPRSTEIDPTVSGMMAKSATVELVEDETHYITSERLRISHSVGGDVVKDVAKEYCTCPLENMEVHSIGCKNLLDFSIEKSKLNNREYWVNNDMDDENTWHFLE